MYEYDQAAIDIKCDGLNSWCNWFSQFSLHLCPEAPPPCRELLYLLPGQIRIPFWFSSSSIPTSVSFGICMFLQTARNEQEQVHMRVNHHIQRIQRTSKRSRCSSSRTKISTIYCDVVWSSPRPYMLPNRIRNRSVATYAFDVGIQPAIEKKKRLMNHTNHQHSESHERDRFSDAKHGKKNEFSKLIN